MSNLIDGINPLTISKIVWFKGCRHGVHPAMLKYLKRKNPVRGFLGLYQRGLFDGYWSPTVNIYGSDGGTIKIISCRSNDRARALYKQLYDNLDEFLSSVRVEK